MTREDLRQSACARLTALLEQHASFSFLRLGDGELAFLLDAQQGRAAAAPDLRASVEIAYDGPGIDARDYERLLRSYEQCDYLDRHDNLAFNAAHLPQLQWQRAPALFGNDSPETAMLIYDWTQREFAGYVRGHRCLFAGAEAALLRELFSQPAYRALYAAFWPAGVQPIFHQVRGDGERLSEHLDAIKSDLAEIIRAEKIDTLFLCLGGAAKPLCHELSRELQIRALDFGSMLRGLTYSGSSGAALWRSSHHPFFARLPFSLYMAALERAQPRLSAAQLLAKAHAQLCLDLQRKRAGHSFAADAIDPSAFDPSEENLAAFSSARAHYAQRYRPLARHDRAAAALVAEFDRWCWKKGLGWRGKIFQRLVRARSRFRKVLAPFS